jgi:hypothetical protein
LQEASGTQALNPASVSELHKQSSILADKLTSENVHILKNTDFMKELASTLSGIDMNNSQILKSYATLRTFVQIYPILSQKNTERLVSVNQADIASQLQHQKTSEIEKDIIKEQSRDFEISR